MNSLRNDRDSHLGQIEHDLKDPEDGFWEKNNSEGIVRNSEHSRNSTPVLYTLPIASFTFGISFIRIAYLY